MILERSFQYTLACVALGLFACSSGEKDDPRLLNSSPNEERETPENERLRKMELIRVIDTSQTPAQIVEVDPSDLPDLLGGCGGFFTDGNCGNLQGSCNRLTCSTQFDLCIADILLAVASGTGSSVQLPLLRPTPGGGLAPVQVRFPPQSAAANSALAVLATQRFETAMRWATQTLTGSCEDLNGTTDYTGESSVQGFATASFIDAFQSGKRAYRVAYKNTLAVSDAELSSSNQLEVARIRAISNEKLSRSAAAHLMVGGKAGWFGSTSDAFCTSGRLTGPEQAALSVLREAAPHPLDILSSSVTTDQLVNGTEPNGISYGSVRARLADAWGTSAIPENSPVWDAYGLKKADFEAAREALKNEIQIFGRTQSPPPTGVLAPRALPGGETPEFNRFAGTAGPPPNRPDQYWALLALFDGPEFSNQLHGTWRPPEDDIPSFGSGSFVRTDNLAAFVDRAYSWAGEISRRPELSTAHEEVLNPLTLLLGGEDIQGRLTHCAFFDGPLVELQTFRAVGYEAADQLVLVRGQDLMDCATNGHIEGAACELPGSLDAPPSSPFDAQVDPDVIWLAAEASISGIGPFVSEAWGEFQGPISGRYYLIRPRQKGDADAGPGEWELLIGTPLFLDFQQTGRLCRDVPIVPEATEAAARAIAPSREWCGSSEVTCAGTRFDERLPLEDELSTDHDDTESSWRHYLDLARRAVDHADALGEEFVQAALQDDLREEEVDIRRTQQEERALGEFQRIQEICGSAADPNKVLDLLGKNTDGELDLSNASATVQCAPRPNAPIACGARRVALEHPELGALAQCLGTFESLEEMHLGNGFLCVASKGETFGPDEARVAIVKSCQDQTVPNNVGPDVGCDDPRYHCVPAGDGLQLFDTESLLPDRLPRLCDGIRLLRATPVRGNEDRKRLFDKVKEHDALAERDLRELRALVRTSLNYETGAGPFVTISLGQRQVSSRPGSELCGNTNTTCEDAEDGTARDGLFCRQWNCGNGDARAELNLRLYKAAAALMWPGSRLDTIWYLNHYVQPNGPAAPKDEWRLFDIANGRKPVNTQTTITALLGTDIGFSMGAHEWTVEGDKPTLRDDVTTELNHPDNEPMQLAFRRGRLFDSVPLAFELLDDRPASQTASSNRIFIAPGIQLDGSLGLNAVHRCARNLSLPGFPSGSCDLNFTNLRDADENQVADSIQRELNSLGLVYFSSTINDPIATTAPPSGEAAPASQRGQIGDVAFGKQVFPPAPSGTATLTAVDLDVQARLDAIELACEALGTDRQLGAGCGVAPPLGKVGDFEQLGQHLECLGNDIIHRAATAVYSLPPAVKDHLRNGERLFDATGGALAVAISDLRSSLLEAATSGPVVGGTLRRFGQDIRALRAQLDRIDVSNQINDVQLSAEIAQQTTDCLTAAANSISFDPFSAAGATAAAYATCANSIAQIGFATQINSLQDKAFKLESDQAIAEFSGRVGDYVTTLETQGLRLSQALESVQRNLETIESLQSEAQRALQTALWQLSKQAANQTQISNVLDNLKVGKYLRYQRAFEDAQKMAFLAKRSIEMRLGMSLADMVYDLPLVTAPASWEATVCTTTGIDYAALREKTGEGENFADAFLGDYVTKLEQVVESYRLVNNFHEGSDTAVVSLRDDIHNTRATCESDSRNLLYWASNLEPRAFVPGESPLGWTLTGCDTAPIETEGGTIEAPSGDCVLVRQRSDTPFFEPIVGRPPVLAWDVDFGNTDWCGAFCAYQDGAALSQAVELEPGRYRLSWYTADSWGAGGFNAGHARHADGSEFPIVFPYDGVDYYRGIIDGVDHDWNRIYYEFDVFEKEMVTISFERPSPTDYVIPLAAPMLEKLEDPRHTRTPEAPPGFSDSTDVRKQFLPVCEDTTGANFRTQKWEHSCLKLCPDGYSSSCAEQARTECFWETSFHVSQRSIEAGHMFNQSGFARGNFNYRLRSIGVNFVGTNLRACEDSDLPSTCNAAGFIPYSLIHDGPYYVRNHKGQDYRAHLFPGRIEHARGLGIERYITNPIGDADRTLLEPYLRTELTGRPLDGEFILRVWDEPGVNFDAIQDVQLIIDYGYWTRFN